MEKQKRWQFWLIIAVITLTIINILPTLFYYSQPLSEPVNSKRAEVTANAIVQRVNQLEIDSKEWLLSFSKMLHIKPDSITLDPSDPSFYILTFKNNHDAEVFKKYLPRAGALIPFVPAQLKLANQTQLGNTVTVARQINVHLDPAEQEKTFSFTPKLNESGEISDQYRELINDRTVTLASQLTGPSTPATYLNYLVLEPENENISSILLNLMSEIVEMERALGPNHPISQRIYASFTQTTDHKPSQLIDTFVLRAEELKTQIEKDLESKTLSQEVQNLSENQKKILSEGLAIVKKYRKIFEKGQKPLTPKELEKDLLASEQKLTSKNELQFLSLQERNPYIQSLAIDWETDQILLKFYPDVQKIRTQEAKREVDVLLREKINQSIFNVIASLSQVTNETLKPEGDEFAVALSRLSDVQSFLTFDIGFVANKLLTNTKNQLEESWSPTAADLSKEAYPYLNGTSQFDKKLGLLFYAPAMEKGQTPKGFKNSSIYVIARGLEAIIQKADASKESPDSVQVKEDVSSLMHELYRLGFVNYSGANPFIDPAFSQDRIFELENYYSDLLAATREDFQVLGSRKKAVLDFTNVEQRIITRNQIEDKIQEDLVKWKEDYQAAQVSMNTARHFEVPPPVKNVYWENLKLTLAKYLRGDDRKILKWGLDLSGGKTVRIGLRDHNNRPVTNPDDLKQAVNELYTRVNKMGVAERTIRIENNNIILDFPGSQAFSAAELIKASAMTFHIVNEKFAANPTLAQPVQTFLQNVWNEAVVTNRKDVQSINEIAWKQLGGTDGETVNPRGEAAKILFESGLRLANPGIQQPSTNFDDSLSSIAILRGDSSQEWWGQTHPLVIVFNNYALEGSSLTNVQAGFDPTQGNLLNFSVKGSYEGSKPGNPRDDFYAWTSQFSQDRIAGTPLDAYNKGLGWRMAVILNNQIINAPSLKAALRDGGVISGHFTQREINRLAADLKAGSLSFTPFILSEQNVSPELGKEERFMGISASLIGLFLVAVVMIGYYRFAGMVATCAVLFNLLIMWGVLQNIDAAITLPGLAGIVLTIGMAVDANVLVFERFREEFKISGRLASAMQAGYRKAFSAIVDSNITTILAAIILIQFDSGPIKGFAVTLIIGIISSMFTSLFMTRFFFAGWVQNPKHKSLTFSEWIGQTNFDFIGKAKTAIIISIAVILAGSYFFISERHSLLGMDFTGGYSLEVNVSEMKDNPSYRLLAMNGLEEKGAKPTDIEVRELTKPNQLRVQLSTGMDRPGGPFYEMLEELEDGNFSYDFQRNPRILWVINALESAGLKVQPEELDQLHKNWSSMSGQFSDAMRNNALMALLFALASVLVYITLRFEFKFAMAAVIALAHDIAITLGLIAFYRWIGLPVQIDLEVIGAFMTIIGYSLNDTIIVFDRIREDLHILRKLSFPQVINHAINVTLSRTVMTSGTTLLVLFSLVILGGPSIFDFSLVMLTGVFIGTFSSLFVAGPVLLYFHTRQESKNNVKTITSKG